MNYIPDGNYHFIIRQQLEAIYELQERWPTILCSPSRYAHQAQVAIRLADTITGAALPALSWLTPLVIEDQPNNADDEDMWGHADALDTNTPDLILEPQEIALSDILSGSDPDDIEVLEPELEAEMVSRVSLYWEMSHVRSISTATSC